MPGPLDDIEKRFKKVADKLMGISKKDVDYRLNDLKTYAQRIDGQTEDYAEQVNNAMSGGAEGKNPKDFDKDKDVKKWQAAITLTYENISDAVKSLTALSKDSPKTKRELEQLEKDLKAKAPSAVKPADKKLADELKKNIAEAKAANDALLGAESKIPKEAKEVLKRKADDYLKDGIAKAEKMPKKEVKELPKEWQETGVAKLEKDLSDKERALKSAASDMQDILKGKGGKNGKEKDSDKAKAADQAASFVDQLNITGSELGDLVKEIQKVQKDYAIALKKAKHAAKFPQLVERATRLSAKYKAEHKALKRELGKGGPDGNNA